MRKIVKLTRDFKRHKQGTEIVLSANEAKVFVALNRGIIVGDANKAIVSSPVKKDKPVDPTPPVAPVVPPLAPSVPPVVPVPEASAHILPTPKTSEDTKPGLPPVPTKPAINQGRPNLPKGSTPKAPGKSN